MQDFTGVPAVVDLAAMRDAMMRSVAIRRRSIRWYPWIWSLTIRYRLISSPTADALTRNALNGIPRNRERYEFLKWGQKAFSNFRVVPSMTGIVHQVNLEYLCGRVVRMTRKRQGRRQAGEMTRFSRYPRRNNSHTTMINGLGVIGWGVGGIEAEAVMLGQPMDMLLPDVIGFKLFGKLHDGVTATDLVLTVTQMLRIKGVVDKFVEFYGEGLNFMSLADRATIGNMAPEYGATWGFSLWMLKRSAI